MKLTQIRNATLILEFDDACILVDPMLARQGSLPKLRYYRNNHRNPLVDLPTVFKQMQPKINYALITHCQKGHFDHLDRAGVQWLVEKQIPTFCTPHDLPYLAKKKINTRVLGDQSCAFLSGSIEQVPATHTTGWLTPFMEHGTGYCITVDTQPSIYLMGDTILTDQIRQFVTTKQPDYIVAPTGKAQLDIGAPLLLSESDILELASLSTGKIIANHMGALDHCRIDRPDLIKLLTDHNLLSKFFIPDDGETLALST